MPPDGPLMEFGAAWLGWDGVKGCETRQFDVPGLHDITMTPRKYGFHGTLKPPFRLAEGRTGDALEKAVSETAAALAPATCDGLELNVLGGFLALTPRDDRGSERVALQRVAETCVRSLDGFRALPNEEELARRRKARLSPRQEALLTQWGYPYVMEEFRFHMTLSGPLCKDAIPIWSKAVLHHLPDLPAPFVMDQIALCGEREDGRFELVHRYRLSG